jgi:hypothetical protein
MRFEMLVLRTLFAAVLLTTALLFGSMLVSHGPDMRMAAGSTSTSSAPSVSAVSATTLSLAVQGVCPVLADGVICTKAD